MHAREQLAEVIDQILEDVETEVESSTVEAYKQLSDKCDIVINKIKNRKNKKVARLVEE